MIYISILNMPVYSILNSNAINCNIVMVGDGIITLASDKISAMKDIKGVPVIIGKAEGSEARIYGGYIVNTDKKNILIKIDDEYVDKNYAEKRAHRRVFTSIQADIRNGRTREQCYVKDISFSGLGIVTKRAIEVGTRLTMDLYIGNDIVTVVGDIKRSKLNKDINMYESGIALTYDNSATYNYMKRITDELDRQYYKIFDKIQLDRVI